MPVDVHRLSLFGFDLSRYVNYIRAGWRELVWGEPAGIRKHLDVPVKLLDTERGEDAGRQGAHVSLYVAEQAVPPRSMPPETDYQAVRIPADKVLIKQLHLPAALELELEETLALEVHASSPFPVENTCYGWAIRGRDSEQLHIVLAIAEKDAVDGWLEEQGYYPSEGDTPPEVWVFDAVEKPIVLSGFGETRRYREYSRRLRRFGAKLLFVFLCIVLLAAVPGMVRKLQVDKMEGFLVEAEQESAEAQALREQLLQGNTQIESMNSLFAERIDYHRILDYLSEQAPDTVYLQRFEAEGRQARLSGWSDNAGAFMQALNQDGSFGEVSTSSAFSRDRRTGLERFVLEMELPATAGNSGD